jgi:hypothetical protein
MPSHSGAVKHAIFSLVAMLLVWTAGPVAAQDARPWGEPAAGIQVRLRALHGVFEPGRIPLFLADIRNQGTKPCQVWAAQESCELELDGARYAWRGPAPSGKASALKPGLGFTNVPVILTSDWRSTNTMRPLELAEGTHTLALVLICPASDDASLTARSNPIEFVVGTPPATEPAASVQTRPAAITQTQPAMIAPTQPASPANAPPVTVAATQPAQTQPAPAAEAAPSGKAE